MPQPSVLTARSRILSQVQSGPGTGQQPSALARDSHMAITTGVLNREAGSVSLLMSFP